MYMSDEDGDDFEEVCLPVNLEDDGYNMIHTHDDYAAFILAGARLAAGCWVLGAGQTASASIVVLSWLVRGAGGHHFKEAGCVWQTARSGHGKSLGDVCLLADLPCGPLPLPLLLLPPPHLVQTTLSRAAAGRSPTPPPLMPTPPPTTLPSTPSGAPALPSSPCLLPPASCR